MSPRLHSLLRFLALPCALGCALWCAPSRSHAALFQIQTVDSSGADRGIHNSLARDSRGVPHISYYGDDRILYASRRDTTWSVETVDSAGQVGYYTSLAIDANDVPHISYFDIGRADLRYATKAPGYWVTEVVDSAGSVGQWGAIALDRNGNPAITYFDNTNGRLKFASRANGAWTIEVADSTGTVGFYTSLAYDASGQACVSYLDLDGGLKFARRTPSGWELQRVDEGSSLGAFTSLALDPAGRAHISYADVLSQSLKYAEETSTGWYTETVDPSDQSGSYTSIALAGTEPRITYIALQNKELRYAARTGILWSTEVVDPAVQANYFSSIELSADGSPMISYYDAVKKDLKLADSSIRLLAPRGGELWAAGSLQTVVWAGIGPVDIYLSQDDGASYAKVTPAPAIYHNVQITVPPWTTGIARAKVVRDAIPAFSTSPGVFSIAPGLTAPWWTKLVDGTGLTGFNPSLRLTPDGSPRISYWDVTAGAVRYASRTGGIWTSQTVQSGMGARSECPLAISAIGIPSVAYFDNAGRRLGWAPRINGSWTPETVVPLAAPGEHCSMTLDRSGSPRIAYHESAPGRLVLAARFGTSWATEDVDVGADVGLWNSLAVDSAGYPYISYYDASAGDLKFASKTGGPWALETVDAVGDVGANTSLALDADRNPHVSYVDVTNGFLKYAAKAFGVWRIETVDNSGRVGGATSIALDAAGIPRMVYHDRLQRKLWVASRAKGFWTSELVTPATSAGTASSLMLDLDGNARIAYTDDFQSDLRYASSAVELNEIVPGARWPIGAHRTIGWEGLGSVDVLLSRDGGGTFGLVAAAVIGSPYSLLVPGPSSPQCELRIRRAIPFSTSTSDTFTILAGVDLLSFRADQVPFEAGADVTWRTDPTVPDLSGYRLERALGGSAYTTLLPLTTALSFRDGEAGLGTRYRLTAINGAGGETVLGETEFRPRRPLAAGPLPYRGGSLAISFAAVGTAGAPAHAEVRLYDMRGRLVRTIARGDYAAGFQSAEWNGTDERGRSVASGIYVLKSVSGGREKSMKITVVR